MIRASDEFKKKLKNTLELTDGWIKNGVDGGYKEYYCNVRELLCSFATLIEDEESNIIELKTDDEFDKELYSMLRKEMDKIQ